MLMYKKNDNCGRVIPFATSRGKMEGCESFILSFSMDGHRCHVSIFPLTKVITKRRIILDIQFPNQPLGVKWKVVKVLHYPSPWMDTGVMSLSSC